MCREVDEVVQYIAGGAAGRRFGYRAGQIGHSVVIVAMFLRICVAQALNRADGTRHSLHASA